MKATTSTLLIAALSASGALAQNYETYPSVKHTASINGFADPIYDQLPSCAKKCVEFDTGNTPCPYWDPGCLCFMPQWSGEVGSCFAENCAGDDVKKATDLAYGICDKVGASKWDMPSSVSAALSSAADAKATSAGGDEDKASSTDAAPASSAPATTAAATTAKSSGNGDAEPTSAATGDVTSTAEGDATSATPSVTSSGSDETSDPEETSVAEETDCEACNSSNSTATGSDSPEQVNGGASTASYGIFAIGAIAGALVLV